jgi:glycosyltransferase involved in cell wall biosynthesis
MKTGGKGEFMSVISHWLGTHERPSPTIAPGPGQAEERNTLCTVTVVIPALNEAEAIGSVVGELLAQYPDYEVLVVDDGSTDNTGELAALAGARVIRHDWNKGYGASLRTGCRLAKGDIIVCFDGDGQHNPDDVKRLVDEIGAYDMVVGTRSRDSYEPPIRRPGKFVLSTFANFLAGVKIPDVNSGFRAFKRGVILRYLHLMPTGFSFSTTSTFAMLKSGRPVKWVPITVKKRIGASSVSQTRHGLQTLLLMLRLTTLFEPLKVFLPISAAFMLVALGFLIANFAAGRNVPQTSVIMSVSSIMVFLMGLVMDQVAALRREKHE